MILRTMSFWNFLRLQSTFPCFRSHSLAQKKEIFFPFLNDLLCCNTRNVGSLKKEILKRFSCFPVKTSFSMKSKTYRNLQFRCLRADREATMSPRVDRAVCSDRLEVDKLWIADLPRLEQEFLTVFTKPIDICQSNRGNGRLSTF